MLGPTREYSLRFTKVPEEVLRFSRAPHERTTMHDCIHVHVLYGRSSGGGGSIFCTLAVDIVLYCVAFILLRWLNSTIYYYKKARKTDHKEIKGKKEGANQKLDEN